MAGDFSSKLDMIDHYWNNPGQWEIDNNNAEKERNMASAPRWQQYGFESEAAYNNVYGQPAKTIDVAAPTDPNVRQVPTAPADSFGDYLRNNPGKADAWAYLEALLEDYGLGQLSTFVQEQIIEGRSQSEVVQRLRETDTYKTRFAAIEQRKQKGLPAISEAEVVAYERQATQLMRSAGLPEGFWDSPDDFTKLQVSDVSVAELSNRINDGYVAAMQAPAEMRSELENLYGVGMGGLAAFFIDPDRTESVLMKQFAASQASAAGVRSGYGSLNQQQAERLAALGIGDQADAGFQQLQAQRELFGTMPGEAGSDIDRDTQLAATFGNDALAQQRIKRQAESRVARFNQGGGFTQGREGYVGLGTAK